MTAPAGIPKAAYPTEAVINRTVKAARAAGLDPAGIEVLRDGTIRIVEARAMPSQHGDLFEQLEKEGRL